MGSNDRPTRVRYAVLAALCLLAILTYVQRVGFASTGTQLKEDLGLDDGRWGIVMAAFLVAYALFEMPWGLAGDRLGARHLLVVLVLGWSLLTAAVSLVAYLPGEALAFYALLALRFLFGMFQAGGFPAISRVLTDWIPVPERGTSQGFIWMFSRLGGALAPFLMFARGPTAIDWHLSFLFLGALGAVWCLTFWPWFRNRPEEMSWVNQSERELIAAGRGQGAHRHLPLTELFQSRSVWALCFMYGFGGLSATFFITMLPAYLRKQRGLTESEMQWLTSLPLACGVVACVLGGFLSDTIIRRTGDRRWGRRVSGLIGHTGAGVALLSATWAEETWLLAILLALTFFCNDLAIGPAWAACADIGERCAGTLGGAMNMVGNLGGALGALIAGGLFGRTFTLVVPGLAAPLMVAGNDLVFLVFAGSFWLAALCWLGVDVTRPLVRR